MTAIDLSPVMRPVSTARGLPNPFYVDPAVFEAEKVSVFWKKSFRKLPAMLKPGAGPNG